MIYIKLPVLLFFVFSQVSGETEFQSPKFTQNIWPDDPVWDTPFSRYGYTNGKEEIKQNEFNPLELERLLDESITGSDNIRAHKQAKSFAFAKNYFHENNPFIFHEKNNVTAAKLLFRVQLRKENYRDGGKSKHSKYLKIYRMDNNQTIFELNQVNEYSLADIPGLQTVKHSVYLNSWDVRNLVNSYFISRDKSDTVYWKGNGYSIALKTHTVCDIYLPIHMIAQFNNELDYWSKASVMIFERAEYISLINHLGGVLYDMGLGY